MTTKVNRGRDPEQHLVHGSRAEADKYKGMHGEITLVADGTGDRSAIIELRVHNAIVYGGFIIPLLPAQEVAAPLTVARAVTPLPVTTTGVNEVVVVTHELGYTPMVQVINSVNNTVVNNLVIEHHDTSSLSVTIPAAGSYEILLR